MAGLNIGVASPVLAVKPYDKLLEVSVKKLPWIISAVLGELLLVTNLPTRLRHAGSNGNNRINLEKEMIMTFRIDIKSFIVGLLVGLVAIFALGSTSSRNEGVYQLSMTSFNDTVIYGRVNTGTGRIETWSHSLHNTKAIPHLGDNLIMLHRRELGR